MKRNEASKYEPVRLYTPCHEVLPYNLEFKLPDPVIDKIYSFLRPKYIQDNMNRVKIERINTELNHKYTRYYELKIMKEKRKLLKKKEDESRREIISRLTAIEDMLRTYLLKNK